MPDNPFRKKLERKNEVQLRRVINNPHQFRPEAVEAAIDILNERKEESPSTEPAPKASPDVLPESKAVEKVNPRFSLRAIATYQILSALLIMPSIFGLYPQVIGSARNTAILVFFTLLYLTGLVSGALIMKRKYAGIVAGSVFNFFQVIYMQINTITYFSTGLFSFIYIFPFGLDGNIGIPSFLMSFQQSTDWIVGVNLVAITAFVLLLTAESAFHEEGEFPDHLY